MEKIVRAVQFGEQDILHLSSVYLVVRDHNRCDYEKVSSDIDLRKIPA